ncbi:centrosomal protein of 70 kDa isoform 2-T2 [Menidia menidia]
MKQEEQVEWDQVNRLLQHHGFHPVLFADPVENRNLSDLVLLDKRSAAEVRSTLRTMLTDSERRQALVQELVRSNNRLKEEAQQRSLRVQELEALLEQADARVQDLEQAEARVQDLEQEQAARLHRKLYFLIKEEEQRAARHRQQEEPREEPAGARRTPGSTMRQPAEEDPGGRRPPQACLCLHYEHLLAQIGGLVTGPGQQEGAQLQALLPTLEELRSPTRHTLASMLSHFQQINSRDLLELDSRAPPAQVDQGAELDRIIQKLRRHDEFFPAFHALSTEILDTLGVSRLDQVLPALRALKQGPAPQERTAPPSPGRTGPE